MASSAAVGVNKITIVFPPGDQLTSVLFEKEKDTKIEDLVNRLCTLRGIELDKCKKLRILNEQGEKIDLSQTVVASGVGLIDIIDKTTDKEEKRKLKEAAKEKEEEDKLFKTRPPPPHIKHTLGQNCYIPLEEQLHDDEKVVLAEVKKTIEASKYFSDEFIVATLFARKFDLKRIEEFLTATVAWRKEKGFHKIPRFAELDKRIFEIQTYYTTARDNDGRSVRFVRMYKSTPNQNGQTLENLTKFAVWMSYVGIFADGIDGLRNGVCIVGDVEGYTFKQFDPDFQKATSELWMERFPLLLRKFLIINPPVIFSAIIKIASNWSKNKILQRVQPISRKDIVKHIPPESLPEEFGGTAKWSVQNYLKNLEEWAERNEDRLSAHVIPQ